MSEWERKRLDVHNSVMHQVAGPEDVLAALRIAAAVWWEAPLPSWSPSSTGLVEVRSCSLARFYLWPLPGSGCLTAGKQSQVQAHGRCS